MLAHPQFAALHYTGSTAVFRQLYGQIGEGVAEGRFRSYPRIVGETGGKNFHLIHSSADIENAAVQTVRGAFEYQGQKCSATSRVYVPASIWPQFKTRLVDEVKKLKVGNPWDHQNFIGPVIHTASFKKLSGAIDDAKNDKDLELLVGGTYDDSTGYFIHPTVYEAKTPDHKLFSTELFGPVLTAYVYDDTKDPVAAFSDACDLVDSTSEYGLTGSIFAADRAARAIRGGEAPGLGGQFLHQLQEHRRGRRPAAVRWKPSERHQRQGRQHQHPHPIRKHEEHQGGVQHYHQG